MAKRKKPRKMTNPTICRIVTEKEMATKARKLRKAKKETK